MNTEIRTIKNLLLVEDDPQDVQLTLAALAKQQLTNQVVVARDGAEALDYLYRRGEFQNRAPSNPILVLLDLKMPKVNGLEVLKLIKADEDLKSIPVVVFSSSRETRDLIECYQHGVNAYVVKPVDFDAFMKAVKQLDMFWTTLNEPSPHPAREENGVQNAEAAFPGRLRVETNLPHHILVANDAPGIQQ